MSHRNTVVDFWKKVDKGPHSKGCWIWTAGTNSDGYGSMKLGQRKQSSHRISYELANGPIPAGMDVLHHCDNRRCVNPEHLFLGTNLDNVRDRESKGRGGDHKGVHNGRTHIPDAVIESIRRRYAEGGVSQKYLAEVHGVSQPYVSEIVHFRTR